ncbi:hypothetical protein [Streptomyces brasiliensis]|uniref:Uncharacterized protein n=1 Tax=Streptomyces brasiliensis TaxID=1954 RepID=A0A917LET7_9ACTN|nr:hypothetical protein [Streptomyces brasiliensis]GGJ59048.1 hypothetical protein GCM10010121_082140 [Streptomyces brasiliensis]
MWFAVACVVDCGGDWDAVDARLARERSGGVNNVAPPAARRRLRGALTDLLRVAPERPDDTAEPVRGLLESVGNGVTLTQVGYLPRALVVEAAERYDWYLPGMVPRTECDVARLVELHELARATRLLAKRQRKLALTARGRQHLADPALLQATAARAWFGGGVRAELAEAASAALLNDELTLDDLTGAVHALVVEAFTLADGSAPQPDDTRHFLWQWLRPGEALGFLAYGRQPLVAPGRCVIRQGEGAYEAVQAEQLPGGDANRGGPVGGIGGDPQGGYVIHACRIRCTSSVSPTDRFSSCHR